MQLRVLFVNPGLDLGGAERCLLLLLRELQRRDVYVTVALLGDGPFASRLAYEGVPTVLLRVANAVRRASRYRSSNGLLGNIGLVAQTLPAVVRLSSILRHFNADIVHTNGLKAHLIGGLAGRLAGRPVVWHLRDFPAGGSLGRLLRSGARRLPRMVLTVSDAVAADIRGSGKLVAPIVSLHDPIDIERFPPGLSGGRKRVELSLEPGAPIVGMVAHLTPWKGHELFLRIAKMVGDSIPETRFLIVGGEIYETEGHDGYTERLKQLAMDLGLGSRVLFLGNREDVPELLSALDVLVHCPMTPEPFGLVVVEAMAAGRPVVGAAAGGVLETVQHDVTGLLVPPGDVPGFASAVLRLLGDPELRHRLGNAGNKRANALFTPSPHAEQVLQAYRSIRSNL